MTDNRTKLKIAEAALNEIAFPIKAIQERAQAEGLQVNGPMAVMLANDANHLKKIARDALAKMVTGGRR